MRLVIGVVAFLSVAAGAYSLTSVSRGPQQPSQVPAAFELQAGAASNHVAVAEKSVTIPVEGMSCASCAAGLRKSLTALDGVLDAKVSLEHRNVRVRYLAPKISPARLVAAINEIGYKAGKPEAEKSKKIK